MSYGLFSSYDQIHIYISTEFNSTATELADALNIMGDFLHIQSHRLLIPLSKICSKRLGFSLENDTEPTN